VAWSLLVAFILAREDLRKTVSRTARDLGIDTRFKSLEALLASLIREVARKNSSFSVNLVEKKILTKDELSQTLERIVSMAYKLLKADSAELALFDRESGTYQASFVLGKPFHKSAQAMLGGAMDDNQEEPEPSPDVLIQPIAFAGTILGSLRVALQKGMLPSVGDREVIRLLGLQSGMALMNAQYNEQLLRMKLSSEESVKAKTGFLANLSHEIRGPLGIMLNAVELVLDGLCGTVTSDQLETLQMVRTNGEHLLELINDVLDYAKVESGKLSPQKVDVLIDDILKDICGVVRKQAEAKSHKLTFKPSGEALAISCDRRHLRQMLINLMTNAIKYTPDGGNIEVWAERVPGKKIKINVKDSGVGIEPSARYKVFAAFERVENSYSLNQVGAGLGMPLTKRLAEVNGGLIDFKSTLGQGSQFWLMFPAVQYNSAMLLEQEKPIVDAQGNGDRILIVERDEGERNMLMRYLNHIGFVSIPARSRLEALEILRESKVSLAVIDNNATDQAIGEVIAEIRKSTQANMPVLLLSSRAFVFDIEKYLKAGVDRCLVKPVELKNLGITCRQLIDRTFTGSVIDKSEVDSSQTQKKSGSQPAKTRVLELDDILH